jgi:hypothetical protein
MNVMCMQSDARIAALYEEVLVEDPEERKLGADLRNCLADTIRVGIVAVTGLPPAETL